MIIINEKWVEKKNLEFKKLEAEIEKEIGVLDDEDLAQFLLIFMQQDISPYFKKVVFDFWKKRKSWNFLLDFANKKKEKVFYLTSRKK